MIVRKYKDSALITKEKITENRYTYETNKVYKNNEYNIYWYINQHGYLHILKPCKLKAQEQKLYYCIEDFLLTTYNTLKSTSTNGMFDTLEDCTKELENILNK